jgi:colicin import membrane protein
MFEELVKHPKAIALSILFHLIIIIAIVINFHFFDKPKLVQTGTQGKAIQAKVVESSQLDESKQKKEMEKAERREKELKRIALEKSAVEKKKQEKAEAQKRKLEKQEERLNAQKKAEAGIKLAKEKAAKEMAAREKEKQAEEQRAAEALTKKKEEERIQAKEIEERLLAEKRLQAEQEQKRKEAELIAQRKEADSSRRLSSLRDEYITAIRQKVERNWQRPPGSVKIESCEVQVQQAPGGIIFDVTFGTCSGATNAYRASIENAVYKSEPLPPPGDETLFERVLIFVFNPN